MKTKINNSSKIQEIIKKHSEHIEMMAAAYFKYTDIPPDQVELVQKIENKEYIFYFRKREDD